MVAADTLLAGACAVLETASPQGKADLTERIAAGWRSRSVRLGGSQPPPDRPARPSAPELMRPGAMPRRRGTGAAARTALLHAVAHIELNAIDLAWDLIARFHREDWPRVFYDDWVSVAADEARHFTMLEDRLKALGSRYGALPAHDGLWDAASRTAHDAAARLAAVPLVLEARALDVTPGMVARLAKAGDTVSAGILREIAEEEIAHVAAGWRWFSWLCERRGVAPGPTYRSAVRRHHKAPLKPPFNNAARRAAGLSPTLYGPLSPGAAPSSGG